MPTAEGQAWGPNWRRFSEARRRLVPPPRTTCTIASMPKWMRFAPTSHHPPSHHLHGGSGSLNAVRETGGCGIGLVFNAVTMLCRRSMGERVSSLSSSTRLQNAVRRPLGFCAWGLLFFVLAGPHHTGCHRGLPAITTSPTGLLTFSPPAPVAGLPPIPSNPSAAAAAPAVPNAAGSLSSASAPSTTATLPSGVAIAQSSELEKRIRSLDEANQQLTAQLAQAQQQTKLYKDRSDLMQRQLADVSGQLQSRVAASAIAAMPPPPVVKPPPAMVPEGREFGSNTSRRSGARLTANVSRELESDPLRDLGYEVEVASDGLRLRIPSDQLFQSGSSQLTPSGTGLLDRIAQILKTHYSDRRIAIEGYTDNSPIYGGAYTTSHQLTSAQAEAVLEQWIRRNQLPASQFVTLAHGSNHPISDNQNPAGRAANRRIEVVVQAEGAR